MTKETVKELKEKIEELKNNLASEKSKITNLVEPLINEVLESSEFENKVREIAREEADDRVSELSVDIS